jgi:hypothetical protein
LFFVRPQARVVITSESIDVDSSDPAVIKVTYVQMDDGIDMGGKLSIDRATVPYLVDQLVAATTQYGFPGSDAQVGPDALRVYESGPEQAPIMNVIHERDGRVYGLMLTVPYARKLVDLLRALRT